MTIARGPSFRHAARRCRERIGLKLTRNLYADAHYQIWRERAAFVCARTDGKVELWIVALGQRFALAAYHAGSRRILTFMKVSNANGYRVRAARSDAQREQIRMAVA